MIKATAIDTAIQLSVSSLEIIMNLALVALVATVLLTVASPSMASGGTYIVAQIGLVVMYIVYIMHGYATAVWLTLTLGSPACNIVLMMPFCSCCSFSIASMTICS